jgi:hypothetical protein
MIVFSNVVLGVLYWEASTKTIISYLWWGPDAVTANVNSFTHAVN